MPSSAASRTKGFRGISPLDREADVLRACVNELRQRFPRGWSLWLPGMPSTTGTAGVEQELRAGAPDGGEIVVLAAARRLINTRDVPILLERLARTAEGYEKGRTIVPLLAARYLSPSTREKIAESGAGYADATGNLLLASDRPAFYLRDRGADSDPWRGPGRPRGTLKGPPAARVVRALADFAPPYTVPALAKQAGTSTGATYRVVEFLEEEGLIAREPRGPITDVRWRAVLERWSQDYGIEQSNTVRTFLEPRGIPKLVERLAKIPTEVEYVLTGSLAAERFAPYAPARFAPVYVRDIDAVAEALDLRQVDSGSNVALAAGDYEVVFERSETVDGIRMAAPSQIAVDLLTGPGRNPSEAMELLDWMERNEDEWRR